MSKSKEVTIPDEIVVSKIFLIRDHKVMLDRDLAELYGVKTKRLKEQVRRNIERFPEDFMFELTQEEHEILRSQIAALKRGEHSKYPPFAFTEHGVLMLSSVLNSKRAIEVNIRIMRVYTRLKEMLLTNKDILLKVEQMEKRMGKQDDKIQAVFDYLKQFIQEQEKPMVEVGFKRSKKS
jgi:hypothetical protein